MPPTWLYALAESPWDSRPEAVGQEKEAARGGRAAVQGRRRRAGNAPSDCREGRRHPFNAGLCRDEGEESAGAARRRRGGLCEGPRSTFLPMRPWRSIKLIEHAPHDSGASLKSPESFVQEF